MGNLKTFISFYPLGSIRNTNISIILVDFFIINDKKTSNLNKYIVSIRNNKPMIGLYKGFQHYSFDDK